MSEYTPHNAVVKFNNGTGACLCNGCDVVLSYGFNHIDIERYCNDCYEKNKTPVPPLNDAQRDAYI